MAENKKSFILYTDITHTVEMLTDEQKGKLFQFILDYVNDKDPKTDDIAVKLSFEPIKQQFKRDLVKWESTRGERSKAGKASALARKLLKEKEAQQASTNPTSVDFVQQTSTNPTVTVNATVNVNDINTNTTTKHSVSIDWIKLLLFFNECTGKKSRIINNSVKSKFLARLKEGYTKEDIQTTIKRASQDELHKENNYKYLTIEFVSRSDIMERYTSMKDEKTIKLKMNVK